MNTIRTLIVLIILLAGYSTEAQQVTFRASAKNVVRVGERFQLVYTVNGEGQNFKPPAIEGFDVLSGPSTSQSSSIQIINGSVSRSVEYTFTFILQAKGEEGIFDIPPAEVTVDGKTYKSNPLKVQVVQSGATQQGQQQQRGGEDPGVTMADDLKDDVFVRAVLNKSAPIQGEQVVVTYKLYFRINIASPEFKKEPSFKGFWVNDLLQNRQNLPQYQEVYAGQNYHVAELKKLALFPQRSGQFTIDPLEVTVQAQVRAKTQARSRDPFFDSFFNDPFFNRYQNIEVPLKSNSLSIKVRELPTTNKPADFGGSVGNFDISSSIDRTELKTNEAINLKFTVSGTGNVELVDRLNVSFPPDFEAYDPKVTKSMNYLASGVSGKKTFEYLLIPRAAGTFSIDPVSFTYFDLNKQQYVTLKTPAYEIKVEKGDDSESGITYTGANQNDIRYLGSDIRHIRVHNPEFRLIGSLFFGSTSYYLLLAAPLVLFILFVMIWKKELKKRSNLALMKNRKATKVARKKMKKAETFLKENNKEAFYEEVSQALWGYLSDKFSIPLANLSIDTVNATLRVKEVKEETIAKFTETLNNCEFARFAPGDSQTAMENIYNEAVNLVSHMERELK
jgi:hypothetical protein